MDKHWLIPRKLSDLIPEEHICNFVANLVNELDFSEVEGKYRHTPGKPAYSRKMLLRPVLMASIDGVFSSRKIAKLIRENVVYIHLAGTETPDFRTICSFKNECQDLIKEAFKMTVKIAKRRGIAKLNHISPDGTIIKANANNNNSLTKKELETIRKIIQKGIDVDKEEDVLYGDESDNETPAELPSREEIRKMIKEMQKEEKGESKGEKVKRAAVNLLKQALTDKKSEKIILEKINQSVLELEKSGQDLCKFN